MGWDSSSVVALEPTSSAEASAFILLDSGQSALFGPTAPGTIIRALWVAIDAKALNTQGSVAITDTGNGFLLWGTQMFWAPVHVGFAVPLGGGGYTIAGQLELSCAEGLSATGVAIAGVLW